MQESQVHLLLISLPKPHMLPSQGKMPPLSIQTGQVRSLGLSEALSSHPSHHLVQCIVSKMNLKCPPLPLAAPPSFCGQHWPPAWPPCCFLQLPTFCAQLPEGLTNASQPLTSVKSRTLTMACKPLLASSPAPLPRPTDFFSLLEQIKPFLPQSLAPGFPSLNLVSAEAPPQKAFLTPVPPLHPLCQSPLTFGGTLFIYLQFQEGGIPKPSAWL